MTGGATAIGRRTLFRFGGQTGVGTFGNGDGQACRAAVQDKALRLSSARTVAPSGGGHGAGQRAEPFDRDLFGTFGG